MWTCAACNEVTEDDSWETCWKCGGDRHAPAGLVEAAKSRKTDLLTCGSCGVRKSYVGRRKFHEGAAMGFWLGNLGELFVNREAFVLYACPICGKVDFYIDGVGNELRGESPEP